ncbi:ankyrin repeat protein [Colletotrichum tofieldiae]|nr:ankyrin repeat protein [Colletotrichum tofieldiae]
MIVFLLGQGVRTTGNGRLQYLRAIKFAEREGHLTADWEDLQEEDLEMSPVSEVQQAIISEGDSAEVRAEMTAEEPHSEPMDAIDACFGVPVDMDWQDTIETFEAITRDLDGSWLGAG